MALGEAGPEELVLVTGSLYVVGAARALLMGTPGLEPSGQLDLSRPEGRPGLVIDALTCALVSEPTRVSTMSERTTVVMGQWANHEWRRRPSGRNDAGHLQA